VRNNDLISFEPGKYDIDGENSFVIIAHNTPNSESLNQLEAHRKYIDIQIPLEGSYGISWKALEDCHNVLSDYNPETDVILYSDSADFKIVLNENTFAILLPEDAHWAQPPKENLKKAILKIKV
jgi:YhcH/YjgK/YiaL family protein